jgi:hypothetical protein
MTHNTAPLLFQFFACQDQWILVYCIAFNKRFLLTIFNPLPALTLQSAQDLNAPCWPKCSKALLL